MLGGGEMNDISVSIQPEAPDDAEPIERLHERTFGPGRYAKTAYRLREQVAHRLDLSFTARIGTLLVGSVRLLPGRVRAVKGPARPPARRASRGRAVVRPLTARALREAGAKGERRAILVGDEPYYGRAGFRRIPPGRVKMPAPVDPARALGAE